MRALDAFVMGVILGMLVMNVLWGLKIRDKARSGFRLPLWGVLYRIEKDE